MSFAAAKEENSDKQTEQGTDPTNPSLAELQLQSLRMGSPVKGSVYDVHAAIEKDLAYLNGLRREADAHQLPIHKFDGGGLATGGDDSNDSLRRYLAKYYSRKQQ